MTKPTQEQIKEFAKWCSFTDIRVFVGRPGWDGCSPDGEFKVVELDLNNLFKYAVPKLNGRYKLEGTGGYHFATVWKDPVAYIEIRDTDPALALFWAIWEVIKT